MKIRTSIASWVLIGAMSVACGSSNGALAGSVTDGGSTERGDGNATTVDAAPPDAASESGEGAVDGYVATDATSVDATGEAGDGSMSAIARDDASGSGSDAGDSGMEEAGPYLGSTPSPPTMALIRVANWSSDAPAIDLCIAPHGTSAFQGPIVAQLAETSMSDAGAEGIASPLVSAYTLVAPGQYDARVVVAGSGSCTAGIGADATALPIVATGGAETIALIGDVAPSLGGYKKRVVGFLDDVSPTGATAVRVINAATAMPQVDVGTGTFASKNFLAIFQHVPVGMTGQPNGAWIPFLVDSNGYDSNPPFSNVVLSAHATGATTDAVPLSTSPSATSIPAGAVVTIAVVGGASGTPVSLVTCFDNAGTVDTLGDCIVSM
jgi:hypothetical protein